MVIFPPVPKTFLLLYIRYLKRYKRFKWHQKQIQIPIFETILTQSPFRKLDASHFFFCFFTKNEW